jgi:hypothetical protein
MKRFGYLIILLFIIFFSHCKVEHRDYSYLIKNSTESIGSITLTYQLPENPEIFTLVLSPEDAPFEIYRRNNVTGDDIWNIETSSSLYAIKSLTAINESKDKMTEELSVRRYWSSFPREDNGKGVYEFEITDDVFVLSKQPDYRYYIRNALSDTLFVTSYLQGKSRERDTLLAGELKTIGSNEIFTYSEEYNNTEKYKEKKLSGISSITVRFKENSRTLSFSKYNYFNWDIGKDHTTISVDETYFQ